MLFDDQLERFGAGAGAGAGTGLGTVKRARYDFEDESPYERTNYESILKTHLPHKAPRRSEQDDTANGGSLFLNLRVTRQRRYDDNGQSGMASLKCNGKVVTSQLASPVNQTVSGFHWNNTSTAPIQHTSPVIHVNLQTDYFHALTLYDTNVALKTYKYKSNNDSYITNCTTMQNLKSILSFHGVALLNESSSGNMTVDPCPTYNVVSRVDFAHTLTTVVKGVVEVGNVWGACAYPSFCRVSEAADDSGTTIHNLESLRIGSRLYFAVRWVPFDKKTTNLLEDFDYYSPLPMKYFNLADTVAWYPQIVPIAMNTHRIPTDFLRSPCGSGFLMYVGTVMHIPRPIVHGLEYIYRNVTFPHTSDKTCTNSTEMSTYLKQADTLLVNVQHNATTTVGLAIL